MDNINSNNTSQKINILDIIRVFLRYWPLLLVSVILFIIVGFFYLKFASRTYSVFARIAINTHQVRSSGENTYVNVSDLMNQEKSFTNEISFLRSTPLIKEVIEDMNLFTTYYLQENKIPRTLEFSLINIYQESPFIVIIDENHTQPLFTLFYLSIIDEDKFVIDADEPNAYLYNPRDESVSKYEHYFGVGGVYSFGENIQNEDCSFKVLLNSNYNPPIYQGKDLYFKFNSPTNLAREFQESLSVSTAFYESSIADLTFTWDNLDLSLDFLTELINIYVERNLEKKNYNANNTIEYIDDQLASVSGSLKQSEQQLQSFRVSRDVMNMDEKARTINGQKLALERDLNEVETRYQNLTRLDDYFKANEDSSTFIAPSYIGMSDATLASLMQELTTLSNERQNLISTNQLRNPRIKTLDASIATIKNVVTENINFNLSSAKNELKEIEGRISQLDREISRLPQTQIQLVGLERQYKIEDAVLTSLLDKRIQAQIIKASTRPDCEIIEPVRYVEVASPSGKKILVIALFLGLLFPSIYIIIVNFLTDRIRTKEELNRFCDLPRIGSIPHSEKVLQNVIVNYPQSPITEKFHAIRSNLVYNLLGEIHKCILVTSTLPNEGKSFIALNLAHSFASTNKTLLIGFDLRKKSKVLDELKTNILVGLSNYLIKKAKLEDIIIKTENPNLDFIMNGAIPPNPVALLASSRTSDLFEILKRNYDYIIVDTPPFGLVTDAFLLMKYADLSLYVLRLRMITKKALKQNMDDLNSKQIEKIFQVQNDVSKIDQGYAQAYTYEDHKSSRLSRLFNLIKVKSRVVGIKKN